jgi:hypothetical protein
MDLPQPSALLRTARELALRAGAGRSPPGRIAAINMTVAEALDALLGEDAVSAVVWGALS